MTQNVTLNKILFVENPAEEHRLMEPRDIQTMIN